MIQHDVTNLFRLYFDGYIQSVKPEYINLLTRVDCRDIARQSQISFTTILEIIWNHYTQHGQHTKAN